MQNLSKKLARQKNRSRKIFENLKYVLIICLTSVKQTLNSFHILCIVLLSALRFKSPDQPAQLDNLIRPLLYTNSPLLDTISAKSADDKLLIILIIFQENRL